MTGHAARLDAFAVTVDATMTLREGEWDGARGQREIFDWATGDDDEVDWAKASRGFVVADLNPPTGENITRASFKLPIAYVEDGELVGIGNAIRNALARLSQTEGLSDAVRAEAKTTLQGMLEKLRANHDIHGDVARSEDEQAQIREEFPRLITMTPSQMRDWAASPYAGENRKEGAARESARDALRRVIALKEKPMSDWTEGDYDDAVKAIAFVKRMSEVEQGEPIVIEGREGPSERDASLRDWGHWTDATDDSELPTADSVTQALRGVMALPPIKRAARGWTDKALAGALALLTTVANATVQADSTDRVFRTCTMDFALGAEDRVAVDRALAIADELGPKTDAAQVNSIAERLRADGFADKVTTDGRLIVTGYAARTGSQLYGDGKSTWYEYRSEDEVEKSLKSFDFATFTDDHPPVLVTADNWREYARGMLGTGATLEPADEHGLRFVKVKICVGDISTIRKMRDGKVQLSTGYTTLAVRDPGIDAQGVRYTYRQTDIEVNHQSLVDEARAGSKARVLIDGATVFVFEASKEHDMTKPKKDQMDPEAAMALLDAIKAYAYADSPEAADGAMQAIAAALELDPEMVKQALGGGEMMELDGVKLRVSKDAAARIRASQAKVHGDSAKLTTDLAAAQGELSALTRTVNKLEADKAEADMRELEREIAPLCPQLVSTWSDGKRPDSMTSMRVAAILDLDPAAKVDLDSAIGPDPEKPAPTFDAFVNHAYAATKRHATARKSSRDGSAVSIIVPKIDTTTVYGKPATTT